MYRWVRRRIPIKHFSFNISCKTFSCPYREMVTGDGTYNINIPVSGITAGAYHVWVKVGDSGVWMKSNTTYTHSAGNG